MSDQLGFFEESGSRRLPTLKPHAYLATNAQTTSREAAENVLPKTGTQRRRVYDYIVTRGPYGATDEEIQGATGIRVQSETPRRLELVEAGLIKDSGRRRPTPSGTNAIVWVVIES